MRVYPFVCFALVTIVVTQTQFGDAGRNSFFPARMELLETDEDIGIVPRPVSPIKRPKGTPQITFCPVSSKITSFLSRRPFEKFFFGRNEATERRSRTRMTRSVTRWAYNCLHAGLNVQENIFEMPTYRCCEKCEFPNFPKCMQTVSGFLRQSKCNSKALRCIARCINTKGGQPVRPAQKRKHVRPVARVEKCPTTRKRVGNSYCLERSCIPV